jgi:hypothetical protein
MTTLSSLFNTQVLGIDYVKVSDVKNYNVNGGTFTQDAWRTRDINTEDSDASGICTIDSNQITLEAGTYICNITAYAFGVNHNIARLYNITDSEVTLTGLVTYCRTTTSYSHATHANIMGKFTIASQKTFEVQHYCTTTKADAGMGIPHNVSGIDNIYLVAEFFRIKDLSKAFSEVANYVKVSDVKAYNVDSGTFTQDAWRTRDINTEDSDASGICSISSNQITLAAGTYICIISCPALRVDHHIARLYNDSDSEEVLLGTSEYANPTAVTSNRSWITGLFTIASSKTFEVQHYSSTTKTDSGFGSDTSISGIDSIYTTAEFWRVAT